MSQINKHPLFEDTFMGRQRAAEHDAAVARRWLMLKWLLGLAMIVGGLVWHGCHGR